MTNNTEIESKLTTIIINKVKICMQSFFESGHYLFTRNLFNFRNKRVYYFYYQF